MRLRDFIKFGFRGAGQKGLKKFCQACGAGLQELPLRHMLGFKSGKMRGMGSTSNDSRDI